MTNEQFETLWQEQEGLCAICRTELQRTGMRSHNIDHCHKTGRVRGLLCRACNWGMGILGDDPDRLEAAATYLRR
ncbi:endonuclease VII domain-containing protein [Amycolatopsis speibonae]|uniref:Endonuclease VII domain-containing protein n=1 Tax=Amycolatopsis speibonae TaxID=1450224 RepID=A0ABV7P6E2_9PSEU